MRTVTTASAAALVLLMLGAPARAQQDDTHGPSTCTPLPLVSATTDDAGGRWYVFRAPNGDLQTQVVPPPDFDPRTSPPEVLRRYHVEERPTDPEGLALWNRKYRDFKGFAEPGACVDARRAAPERDGPS